MADQHGDDNPFTNPHAGTSGAIPPVDFLQEIRSMLDQAKVDIETMVNERLNTYEHSTGPRNVNTGGHLNHGERTGEFTPGQVSDVAGYRAFRRCGAQEFTGIADAVESYDWIYDTEQAFSLSKTLEEDKVMYAVGMLKRSAREWWRNEYTMLTEERRKALTWDIFKEKFLAKYCPRDIQRRFVREYLDLKQGDMTVAAYETEFRRKMTFAGHHASTEEDRVERFIEGLRIDIRENLDDKDIGSLEDAARLARKREHILELKSAQTPAQPKKFKFNFQSQSSSSFPRSTQSGRSFFRKPSSQPSSVRL